jgi:HK97 family phage major capsid protein
MAIINRSDASPLIPEVAAAEIIQDTAKESAVLSYGRRVTMSTNQTRLPVMSALPQAYFLDGDTDNKPRTDAQWENVFINAAELAVIVPVPEAVLDDASFDIFGEIRPHLATAFGRALDNAVLFGINKPSVWGDDIVSATIAAGNTVASGAGVDIAEDISAAMAKVEADGYEVNGHLAPVTIRAELRDAKDLNNNRIYQPNLQADAASTVYGSPIGFQRNGAFDTSAAKVIVGDWSQLVVAVRQDLTFKLLDQAVLTDGQGNITYSLAEQDMVALRAVMRVGFAVPTPVSHEAGSNRYPFAVITPPAGS